MNHELTIYYVFAAITGICIGSFINVVITRLPEKGKFLGSSRSECPSCGHIIRWYDLVPVLSYILLLGRCRDCKAFISPRYPIVELSGVLFAILSIYRFGFDFQVYINPADDYAITYFTSFDFATILVFGVSMILLAVTFIDFKTSEIPDSLVIALTPFAVASVWLFPDVSLLSHVIGFLAVALPMFLTTIIVPGAFGGGDIKLMAVCGFLLGWELTVVAFFIAIILGGSTAIYLMASGRRKKGQHMVFGPSLCAGVVAAMYYGNEILNWYLSIFWF
jgi:leader peptidase (prepilin peptidase)/N-methyltransferase